MTLNSWMGQCFAQESWDQVGPLIQPRWMVLGKQLVEQPGRSSQLLLAAHQSPPAGAARSWVPLAHPLQISPNLYGLPASSFAAFAADTDEGSEHLALLADTAHISIQEIHRRIGLSPAYLMAFANFNEVQSTLTETDLNDAVLRGFDFQKYRQLFEQFDNDPGARWFWSQGDELLGPPHYGAALGRFIDRLYEAGLEEEGANDARFRAATSLAHAAFMSQAKALPIPKAFEDTHAILEWAPAFLSAFAAASRHGSAETYLKNIACSLSRQLRLVIGDASFLIRLAPELFAYYLVLWELTAERSLQ